MLISGISFGQNDIKLNALALVNQRLELSYELPLSPNIGIEPIAGLNFRPWGSGVSVNEEDISIKRFGWALGTKANFYLNKNEDLTGIYMSPYLMFRRDKIQTESPAIHTRFTTGLMIGRKGFFHEKWGYLIEGGLGYNVVYGYKDKISGESVPMEDAIPFIGSLTKIAIPLKVTLVYRLSN